MKNKISIYGFKRVVIEGYDRILSIAATEIRLNNFVVIGSDLKIIALDTYLIEISGDIQEVKNEVYNNNN